MCFIIAIITIYISFANNNKYLTVLNNNYLNRANQMNSIVNNYTKKRNGIKVLALGFMPEVYVYLDTKINYKYFIAPSVDYSQNEIPFLEQYKYVNSVDPDIIVLSNSSLSHFPSNLRQFIMIALNTYYDFIGEVVTNNSDGSYYVYGKK